MKIFDIHIGLSDVAIDTGKDPKVNATLNDGKFPNQFDYGRAKSGNLDAFCSFICPVRTTSDGYDLPENQQSEVNLHLDFFRKEEELGNISIVKSSNDLTREGLKVIIGLEGAYFLKTEKDFEYLERIVEVENVKIIGPKWKYENEIINNEKITKLGKKFFDFCEKKNIIIDLAHTESDFIDIILNQYDGIVMNSHTNLFTVFEQERNIRDETVRKIISRGGIIGLNFVGKFVGGRKLDDVTKQFSRFIELFGTDSLCIGSDFDGMKFDYVIEDLEDVTMYNNLLVKLRKICNNHEINSIAFDNANNFFKRKI